MMIEELPTTLVGVEQYPQPEGNHIEFKQSYVNENAFKKIYKQTICGFLNSGGGYLLFGIDDRGYIMGIPKNNKVIDGIKLFVDSVIKSISTTNGVKFLPDIKVKTLETNTKKYVVAIVVISPTDIGPPFQCEGIVVYRLNASNHIYRTQKLLTEAEQLERAAQNAKAQSLIIQKIETGRSIEVKELRDIIIAYKIEINQLRDVNKRLKEDNDLLKDDNDRLKGDNDRLKGPYRRSINPKQFIVSILILGTIICAITWIQFTNVNNALRGKYVV